MMHLRRHMRASSIAWLVALAALVVCYMTLVAGLLGVVGAPRGAMTVISAAIVGCVAVLLYLVTGMRELRP
jgi:hypothetical protein